MSAPTVPAADPAALRAALLRYVRSRVADPATAEDLVHDIFLRATRQQHHVREDGAYVGWLFRIARNRIIDHYRARKPAEPWEDHLAGTTATETQDPEETRLRAALSAYIRGVVEGLPPIYREALLATDYEGLRQTELARRLRLSVPTVKSRVQRARALVRAEIERCCSWETDVYGAVTDCRPKSPARCDCKS